MKNILISGANGFVGSSLSEELSKEYNVTCMVRNSSDTSFIPKNVKIIPIDYNSEESYLKCFEKQDVFIHCAAATRAKNWEQIKKINVDLTEKLLNASNKNDISQFIFLSSQAAAGPSEDKPKTEDDESNPISLYGKSKLYAENIIKKNARIPYTIIRPSSVYGPKDKDFLQYFKLIKFRLAFQIGMKPSYIAMIYVKELIKLIKLTILNQTAFNETFFAAEDNYSTIEFIESLEKAMQIKAVKIKIPELIPDSIAVFSDLLSKFRDKPLLLNSEKVKEIKIKNWTISNEKAKNLLGYKPNNNLTEHLRETYEWYKKNNWL